MAEVLIPRRFCAHASGVVMTQDLIQCADCHTEMVFVAKDEWDHLHQAPDEKERARRLAYQRETTALLRIYHTLGDLLMSRGAR